MEAGCCVKLPCPGAPAAFSGRRGALAAAASGCGMAPNDPEVEVKSRSRSGSTNGSGLLPRFIKQFLRKVDLSEVEQSKFIFNDDPLMEQSASFSQTSCFRIGSLSFEKKSPFDG
jgi:hypothetical protein